MAELKNTTIDDTGFIKLPVGLTAQRPTPSAGQIRLNTDTGKIEQYNAGLSEWIGTAPAGVVATGGTVYDVDTEGTTYRVHVFTNTGNSAFTVSKGGEVEYLIVAGGGAGGSGGGAGGAGGLLTGTVTVTPQSYTITVGAGGVGTNQAASGANGSNSSALGLTAIGGGGGGGISGTPQNGGSGGGGNKDNPTGGAGTAGQGNAGGNGATHSTNPWTVGGGGGGAGSPGQDANDRGLNLPGNGGIGFVSFISGVSSIYAGGGGAGTQAGTQNGGSGGIGGGGDGGQGPSLTTGLATSGTPNTGGGGGSANEGGSQFGLSGSGGSGIVVIRYPLRQENTVTAAGKVIGDGLVLDVDFAKPTVYSGSGTVVNDSRLNGIEGTLVNGPVFTDPRTHRSAFSFNASNNYITSNQNINLGENITITGWFKSQHNTNTNRTVVSIGTYAATPGSHWIFLPRTGLGSYGRIAYLYRENNTNGRGITSAAGNNLVDGNYHWFAFVIQPTGLRCFIDGSLSINTSNTQSNYIFTNKIFQIGADGQDNQVFDGEIADIKIYNLALLDNQLINLYNATRWRFGV